MTYEGLPNFDRVDLAGHLYRGAQPRNIGIRKLAQLHIQTIVDLLPDAERSPVEGAEARHAGMAYIDGYRNPETGQWTRFAMNGFFPPNTAALNAALDVFDDPKMQPVFVHCSYGKDRTGTVVACYRIRHGWSAEAAIREANRYSMGWWEVALRGFIREYARGHRAGANGSED